ncbi:MAG: LacI family DNA-binding transcriptional regulator [Chitinophagaceae bacterium]
MENINLKRLAQELNLSASTVSRALRGSHEISQETKERVKALAEKLGFQPNPHASSLRQSKSSTIAVIIPEIENNFFSKVMNGVEAVAQKKGYHVLIYLTHEAYIREKDIVQVLRNGRVDGMMISISNTTTSIEHLQDVKSSGLPLVFFDRIAESIDVPTVSTDDKDAAYKGTVHLIEKNCKRIALLSMSSLLSITTRRQNGYQKALESNGLSSEGLILECENDDEANRIRIRELLTGENRPDGIFASVEKLAINTYEVCSELDIKIPGELKVISFSNLSATALFDPPLTTIVQPAYEIGKEAAAVLFKIIEKKTLLPGENRSTFPSHIIERKSTAG